MSKVNADYFPRTINQYVPNMEFAADVVGDEHIAYLGAPAAADPDGIWDGIAGEATAATFTSADYKTTFDGSSTSLTTTSGMIDATYGRCLTVVASAGADHVLTITGRDYLGQVMVENITVTAATQVYGNKAFKFVDTVLVGAGQASDTIDIGWGDRLGLPYKAEKIVGYTEDDVTFPIDVEQVLVEVDAVRFAAGTDVVVPSPIAGQVVDARSVVTTATTGASTSTVVVVATNVAGTSIVIATSASVGDQDTSVAVTDNDQATGRVDKFEALGISPDSTPSAGAANYVISVDPIGFVAGDDTATQTATTEDTRGTILCTTDLTVAFPTKSL